MINLELSDSIFNAFNINTTIAKMRVTQCLFKNSFPKPIPVYKLLLAPLSLKFDFATVKSSKNKIHKKSKPKNISEKSKKSGIDFKDLSKDEHESRARPEYNSLNEQLSIILSQTVSQEKEPFEQQELTNLLQILANASKLIFLKINDQKSTETTVECIDQKNFRSIQTLIKRFTVLLRTHGNTLPKGQQNQMCQILYLSAIVGQQKSNNNFSLAFSQHLQQLDSKGPAINCEISFQSRLHSSKRTRSQSNLYVIDVKRLLNYPVFMHNLGRNLLEFVIQKQSFKQIIEFLRNFSTLFTLKELRKIDNLLSKRLEKLFEGSLPNQNPSEIDRQQTELVLSIASILSQLRLNGQATEQCQKSLSKILKIEISSHQQVLGILQKYNSPQALEKINDSSTKLLIDFNQLMKCYVAFTELQAESICDNLQKLLILKLKISQLSVQHQEKRILEWYSIGVEQSETIVSLLHKYKTGRNIHTMESGKGQNIWIAVIEFLEPKDKTSQIKEQFYFPFLSGICRILPKIKTSCDEQLDQQICAWTWRGLKKLYRIDSTLSYLDQIPLEKLIQFVVVTHVAIMAQVLNQSSQLKPDDFTLAFLCNLQERIAINLETLKKQNTLMKKQSKKIEQQYLLLVTLVAWGQCHVELKCNQKCAQSFENLKTVLKRLKIGQEDHILLNLIGANLLSWIKSHNLKGSKDFCEFYENYLNFVGLAPQAEVARYQKIIQNHLFGTTQDYDDQDEKLQSDQEFLQAEKIEKNAQIGNSQERSRQLKGLPLHQILCEELLRVNIVEKQEDFNKYIC